MVYPDGMKTPFAGDGRRLDEDRFHARACLLAAVGKQQSWCSSANYIRREEDGDDDDSADDGDTVVPMNLVRTSGKVRLKEKFLDRLAEVLSREKPPPHEKAEHVASAVMIDAEDGAEDGATVYVAKNGGLDKIDTAMLQHLWKWMKAIAADGRRREIYKDVMWKKLLGYYQGRLGFYRQRLTEGLKPYFTIIDSLCATDKSFCGLSKLCSFLEPVGTDWHDLVCIAYELQHPKSSKSELDQVAKDASQKIWHDILLLGRLHVAWETLVETALHLASFKEIKIIPIVTKVEDPLITHSLPTTFLHDFKRLKSSQQKVCKKFLAQPCFVHAEMQLLMHLEVVSRSPSDNINAARAFDYIGCSKKTCYLCCKFIEEHKSFRTRGTHHKVYHQWTIPPLHALPIASVFRINVALLNVENDMKTRFENSFGSRPLPLVAESSIGISVHSEASMDMHRLRQVGLESQRLNTSQSNSRRKVSPVNRLGRPRDSFQAARIPADSGSTIEIVRLTTHETEKGYDCIDSPMKHVLDFSEFWGEAYNFDRTMDRFNATNQEIKSLNGDYRIHWNLNDELPENETLKTILKLKNVPSYRRFWYGDVFIQRIGKRNGSDFDEHGYHIYDNISPEILKSELIPLVFRKYWDDGVLETRQEEDIKFEEMRQKWDRDRELVLQRMWVQNLLVTLSTNFAPLQDTSRTRSAQAHATWHS